MIQGHVENDLAFIPLVVYCSHGKRLAFEVLVDTGFNDWLTLPSDLIQALSLPLSEKGRYSLANGSEVFARFFAAEVDWLGERKEIMVLEMETTPLLGMAILRGSHLSIESREGGPVTVSRLVANR